MRKTFFQKTAVVLNQTINKYKMAEFERDFDFFGVCFLMYITQLKHFLPINIEAVFQMTVCLYKDKTLLKVMSTAFWLKMVPLVDKND